MQRPWWWGSPRTRVCPALCAFSMQSLPGRGPQPKQVLLLQQLQPRSHKDRQLQKIIFREVALRPQPLGRRESSLQLSMSNDNRLKQHSGTLLISQEKRAMSPGITESDLHLPQYPWHHRHLDNPAQRPPTDCPAQLSLWALWAWALKPLHGQGQMP